MVERTIREDEIISKMLSPTDRFSFMVENSVVMTIIVRLMPKLIDISLRKSGIPDKNKFKRDVPSSLPISSLAEEDMSLRLEISVEFALTVTESKTNSKTEINNVFLYKCRCILKNLFYERQTHSKKCAFSCKFNP